MILTYFLVGLLGLYTPSKEYNIECTISQNGKTYEIRNTQTELTIQKQAFSIEFNLLESDLENKKFYATQIALSENKDDMDYLKSGQYVSDIPFFKPGTGSAVRGPYEFYSLYEGSYGIHQYIVYEKEGEQRAELISDEDEVLRLKSDIKAIQIKDEIIPVEDIDISELFLMLISDKNLNGILDQGEFQIVTLHFK